MQSNDCKESQWTCGKKAWTQRVSTTTTKIENIKN